MTSEEIIQRLLDDKKITVKEAMIILKDLAKIGLQQILPDKIEKIILPVLDPGQTTDPKQPYDVVVMYGVQTNPYTWSNTASTTVYTSASTDDENKNDKKEDE